MLACGFLTLAHDVIEVLMFSAAFVVFVNPAVIENAYCDMMGFVSRTLCSLIAALATLLTHMCSECQAQEDLAAAATVSTFMQHSPVGRRQGLKRAAPSCPGPDDDNSKKRTRVINMEARAGPTVNAAGQVQPLISHSAAEGSSRSGQAFKVMHNGLGVSAGDGVPAEQVAVQALLGLKTSGDRHESSEGWGLLIGLQPV